MFQSPSFTHRLHHRLRTTASCLWLHVAPHSTLRVNEGAVTGLSYPSTPDFSRCQRFQVSPPRPATSASEAILCGRRYALSIRPAGRPYPTFTNNQVTKPFPAWSRFTVAQLRPECLPGHQIDWVEEESFTPQRPSRPHQPY